MDWEKLQKKELEADYNPKIDEEELDMFMRDDMDESESKGIDEEDALDALPQQ